MPLGSSLPTRLPFSSGTDGTFYVDPSNSTGAASDTYTPTQAKNRATPWHTIQHAASNATISAGGAIIVVIGNGISVQSTSLAGVMQWTRHGLTSDPVTLKCETERGVTITGSAHGGAQVRGMLIGNGSATTVGIGLRVQGFIFSVGGTNSVGISVNPGQHCEFYRCTFTNCGNEAMDMKGYTGGGVSSNNWIFACRFYNNSNDNTFSASSGQGESLYLGICGTGTESNADGADSCVVASCLFHAPLSPGPHIQLGSQFRNGFVVNNTFLGGGYVSTVTLPHTTGGNGTEGYADNAINGTQGNIVANNIYYELPGASNVAAGTTVTINMGTCTSNLSFGNSHQDTDYPSGVDYPTGWGGRTYWTVTGNLTNADPKFNNVSDLNNPSLIDARLQAGSPAIGTGLAAYTPTEDYAGATRTAADLGAFAAPTNSFSDAPSGAITFGGGRTEGAVHAKSPLGTITLDGVVSETYVSGPPLPINVLAPSVEGTPAYDSFGNLVLAADVGGWDV